MKLRPDALDHQGYIINQKATDNLSFGRISSDIIGCGWIAAYNFLKAAGAEPSPEQVLSDLQKWLIPGFGRFGLNIAPLALYLRRRGIPLRITARPFHAQLLAEGCRAGIILYRTGKTNHYAAFRREDGGKLRFYGATPGCSRDMSLAEFCTTYMKFPLALFITAK